MEKSFVSESSEHKWQRLCETTIGSFSCMTIIQHEGSSVTGRWDQTQDHSAHLHLFNAPNYLQLLNSLLCTVLKCDCIRGRHYLFKRFWVLELNSNSLLLFTHLIVCIKCVLVFKDYWKKNLNIYMTWG